ncbi:substrate-binding domain-containing protein [Zhihengliuella sp.]|uniref:substrate-binding domain-containing protein n=1 Tax=Zhihengliuella sp. TaxID=1954483 RepID=UPI002812822E|nr:substrate-binding domain-containing protein [Zhihengliuella sp.]
MKSNVARRVAAAGLGLTLALTLSACNRGEDAGQKVTLAVSTLNNPFFVDLRDGAEDAAEDLGIELDVVDAQNDSATQANQLATAASDGSAGVIVNAVDSAAAGSALGPVVDAGLPVVAVDRAVEGAEVASLVASDNVAGGEQAAKALAEAVGGKGQIVILEGVPGASSTNERGEGFTKGLAEFPEIEVVAQQTAQYDRATALDVTTNLLEGNPDIVGVLAMNDEMALGAIQALGARAGEDIHVVGFDGTEDGFAAVEDGKLYATIAQNPEELGRQSVEVMSKVLAGEEVEELQNVAVDTVTVENVEKFSD